MHAGHMGWAPKSAATSAQIVAAPGVQPRPGGVRSEPKGREYNEYNPGTHASPSISGTTTLLSLAGLSANDMCVEGLFREWAIGFGNRRMVHAR